MNESQLTKRVGAFVVATLLLLAALVLVFSKGMAFYTPTYALRLKADNIGGLKPRSSVLVSGVPVGSVAATDLAPGGRGVIIHLRIHQRFPIHSDARFVIEQLGFLGDQFVAVYPGQNAGRQLQDGDEVKCDDPFSIQEAARSAVSTLERVDDAVKLLKEAMTRVNQLVLNEQTLTNAAQAVGNFKAVSESAHTAMAGLDQLIQSNAAPVRASISNLHLFSDDLKKLGGDLRQVVAENRGNIHTAITNLEASARSIETITRQLGEGRGALGGLLQDEQLKTHLSNTLARLDVASSNIANYGLLHKPKPPKLEPASPARGSRP